MEKVDKRLDMVDKRRHSVEQTIQKKVDAGGNA